MLSKFNAQCEPFPPPAATVSSTSRMQTNLCFLFDSDPNNHMPNYIPYRDDIETIDPDEQETYAKIIQTMTDGQHIAREKYGKSVRISHAKAHGLLKGELVVSDDLPPEFAQGLFQPGAKYPVVVRLASAPGEFTDDSKISTVRGMAIKVFNVEGPKLPPFEDTTTQDFVLDTGKQFITSGPKAFLQAFKPNAEIAPRLSDDVKGVVSTVARGTNAVLNMFGANSEKLDFYGHEKKHPMAESYYSQTPSRYGGYVAKLGVVPATPGLVELEQQKFDPQTPDALREATVAFFKSNPAEFNLVVQLNTDLEKMPIEDAMAPWSEEDSPYVPVARLVIPAQDAFGPARADVVDENFSFSPTHSLVAHRPLGGINRARLVAYTAMANLRRQENNRPTAEPASIDQVPA